MEFLDNWETFKALVEHSNGSEPKEEYSWHEEPYRWSELEEEYGWKDSEGG